MLPPPPHLRHNQRHPRASQGKRPISLNSWMKVCATTSGRSSRRSATPSVPPTASCKTRLRREHLQAQVAAEADPAKKLERQPDHAGDDAGADGARDRSAKRRTRSMRRTSSRCWRRPTPTPAASCARVARSLERAQRDMARAGQQRQMAEQQADAARRAAGLSTTTSGLNVALKSMQDAAARDLANAEAANMKAMALLSNFGPVVLMDFGPPPVPQPTVARADRGAWRGLESQSGFVRAASSGA